MAEIESQLDGYLKHSERKQSFVVLVNIHQDIYVIFPLYNEDERKKKRLGHINLIMPLTPDVV